MLDARVLLQARILPIVVVLLAASGPARADAQPPRDTTRRTTTTVTRASALQRAAAQRAESIAQRRAAAIVQQQVVTPVQWPAPRPCGGNSVTSRRTSRVPLSVPSLVGSTLQAARTMVANSLLQIDERVAPGEGQRGFVISQSPPPGTSVSRGDTVVVCSVIPPAPPSRVDTPIVSGRAPVTRTMPDLTRATYAQASRTLRALNASLGGRLRIAWSGAEGTSFSAPGAIVVSQFPPPRARVQAGDSVVVVLRDTTTRLRMPDVTGDYLVALQTMSRLLWPNGQQVPFATNGAPDVLSRRDRLVVAAQLPPAGAELTTSSRVMLTLADTTTLALMPDLTGFFIAADNAVRRLRSTTGFPLTLSTNAMPNVPTQRLVVVAQRPARGTRLTDTTRITLGLRDTDTSRVSAAGSATTPGPTTTPRPRPRPTPTPTTTTPAPPLGRRFVIMPDVVGRTVRSARNALLDLGVMVTATATDRDDIAGDEWIVARQSPTAGDTVIAATAVRLYAKNPAFPWIWLAAGVSAAAAAAAATYARFGQRRVARMTVEPHADRLGTRMTVRMGGSETADEAFARIGLSFTPVPHRGVAKLTRVSFPSPYNPHHDG